jgi:hypothetical protein
VKNGGSCVVSTSVTFISGGWNRWEELMYQPMIYPAVLDQLCIIARKKCMSVERLTNLYLQMCVAHEMLMERETACNLLEEVLVRCIQQGDTYTSNNTKPSSDCTNDIAPSLNAQPTGTERL